MAVDSVASILATRYSNGQRNEMIFGKNIENIDSQDIQQLVDNEIAENANVEFKRDLYSSRDKDKREFAADVSAFANASGGTLVLGVDERNGIASSIPGVTIENVDQFALKISDSLRNSIEPTIQDLRVKCVSMNDDRKVVIIHVPKSWAGPHRVTLLKDNGFYIRDENGKHPMSVEELKRLILVGNTLGIRIREFRDERLQLIAKNECPFPLDNSCPILTVLVAPQTAFTENRKIEIQLNKIVRPMSASGWNHLNSIDGGVAYTIPDSTSGRVRSFTSTFRNGCVEANTKLNAGVSEGKKSVSANQIEKDVLSFVQNAFDFLHANQVSAPYYIMITLLNIRGFHAPYQDHRLDYVTYPCRRETMRLPEFLVQTNDEMKDIKQTLRPLVDLIWNAFGHPKSPNYQ